MGCLIRSRNATLPQLKDSSIMDASSVTNPSRSGLAPRPTQQLIEDSVTLTPSSTASHALPPLLRIFHSALLASKPVLQVEITIGLPFTRTFLNPIAEATILLFTRTATLLNKDDCRNFLLVVM